MNTVELIGYYGGDITHAQSAWTSTIRELTPEKIQRIPGLLTKLAKEGHGTPFEKSALHFLCTTDIATHIQLLKHRIGVSCLSGDTKVQFLNTTLETTPKLEMSLQDLYSKWTSGRSHQDTEKDMRYQRRRISKMKIELLNEDTLEISYGHVKNVLSQGVKPVFLVMLENNDTIEMTDDHRVFSCEGWKSVSECFALGIPIARKTHTNNVLDTKPVVPNHDFSKEMWKSIPNFDGYEISNLGRVRSYWNNRYLRFDLPPNTKKLTVSKTGYHVVSLHGKAKLVSRLLLDTFFPVENSNSLQARHLDGNSLNNNLVNLKWGTDAENKADWVTQGIGHPRNRIKFVKIASMTALGAKPVYDLEIDGDFHNFTANGIIVHNCNGESARYKELKEDKYYVPFDWDDEEKAKHIAFCELCIKEYHECYKRLLDKGFSKARAKETARYKLPYSNQLVCDVQFNWRSFVHFQNLRNSTHAQQEIKQLAQSMLQLVKDIPGNPFEHSITAFGF